MEGLVDGAEEGYGLLLPPGPGGTGGSAAVPPCGGTCGAGRHPGRTLAPPGPPRPNVLAASEDIARAYAANASPVMATDSRCDRRFSTAVALPAANRSAWSVRLNNSVRSTPASACSAASANAAVEFRLWRAEARLDAPRCIVQTHKSPRSWRQTRVFFPYTTATPFQSVIAGALCVFM